jgi:Protein of unknown function (DUF1549)/Protein of unknown function (DUF1553)
VFRRADEGLADMHTWLLAICVFFAHGDSAVGDARTLSRRIDERITQRLEAEHVKPAAKADDAELLRRVTIDLIGRIPTVAEVRAFVNDKTPEKRARLVDRLLADPQHARHFARVWRAVLLPEIETDPQLAYFQPGFEAWLVERRQQHAGFDAIVRDLLTVPIAAPDQPPEFVLRDLRKPNPIAFIAAKQADPTRIATSCVRVFLGVHLECAQCHDHPFDRWTQRQFWSQAAFFAGIERRGRGPFAPLSEAVDRRTIKLGETSKMVPVALLDGSDGRFTERKAPRQALAEWMTSRQNPFFARAVVNRIWGQLMGRGLVEPVDDIRDSNPASHPELFQGLSADFAASGFDLTRLYRAICLSEAYQRTSQRTETAQSRSELFAAMSIKPLSPDQFYDSFSEAIGRPPSDESDHIDGNQDRLGRRVFRGLAGDEQGNHPKTSVTDALAMMNGTAVHAAVSQSSTRLQKTLEAFPDSAERQVDELYLATLNRYPTHEERRMMVEHCAASSAAEKKRRLGDVFWILLNSAEFRWNH